MSILLLKHHCWGPTAHVTMSSFRWSRRANSRLVLCPSTIRAIHQFVLQNCRVWLWKKCKTNYRSRCRRVRRVYAKTSLNVCETDSQVLLPQRAVLSRTTYCTTVPTDLGSVIWNMSKQQTEPIICQWQTVTEKIVHEYNWNTILHRTVLFNYYLQK